MKGRPDMTEDIQAERQEPKETPVKKEEEFSLSWHIKVLAVIYAGLAVLYVLLKIFLK